MSKPTHIWLWDAPERLARQLLPATEHPAEWLERGATVLRLRRRHGAIHADVALADGIVHVSLSPWNAGTVIEAHIVQAHAGEARLHRHLARRVAALPRQRGICAQRGGPPTAAATGRGVGRPVAGSV